MTTQERIRSVAEGFAASTELLSAIGDQTRQHILLEMMKMEQCSGVRVGAITARTNLSRPAVSHHLRILKDAGVLKCRREGTKNYYFFDPEMQAFECLVTTLRLAMDISQDLPDRSGEE